MIWFSYNPGRIIGSFGNYFPYIIYDLMANKKDYFLKR